MIITIDTEKKLTEVEVNLLKVLLGTTVSVKNRAEKVPEATKTPQPKPEVKSEVERAPEPITGEDRYVKSMKSASENEAPKQEVITLAELKTLAQECVVAKDRVAVKAVINKFAPKLTDVKSDDYMALHADLTALRGE